MTVEEATIFAALITALLNLGGIWYNFKLSRALKTSDKDDDEKRALRKDIHKWLTNFESTNSDEVKFSKVIAKHLGYNASNVKRYSPELSSLIMKFVKEWRKLSKLKDDSGKKIYSPGLHRVATYIHDEADNLLLGYSLRRSLAARFSLVRFRLSSQKRKIRGK